MKFAPLAGCLISDSNLGRHAGHAKAGTDYRQWWRPLSICRSLLSVIGLAFATFVFSSAIAQADIIYREIFGRDGSTGNINPTNFYWSHWNSAGARNTGNNGISADGTGKPIDVEPVNSGPNRDGTFGPQAEGWHYLDGTMRLTFTAEYSFNPADYTAGSVLFSWYQGNAQTIAGLHLIVRVGSTWYVSVRGVTNTTLVNGGVNFGNPDDGSATAGAQLVTFPFDPAAANWNVLSFNGTFDPLTGTTVASSLGAPVASGPAPSDLSGAITAFGLLRFHDNTGFGNSRFDTFTIEASTVPLVLGTNITWVGNINGDWDTNTANWRTNGGPGTAFANFDFAIFDDTATGPTDINLAIPLRPASVTVSNHVLNYRFTGGGELRPVFAVTKAGAGSLVIDNSGTNNFAGGVVIEAGTLQVGSGGASGTLGGGSISNNGALVINRSGTLTINNSISGTGSLTKNGTGTLLLGSSSHSGPTDLNGGTLVINGTLSGGGAATTAAGTTLGGSGTIAGPVTVSGLVYPGNANVAGTLSAGSVTLNSGAALKFDLTSAITAGSGVNDLLQLNGDLTVNNNSISVNFIGYPQVGAPYRLINYSGLQLGTFNPVVTGTHYLATLDETTLGQVNVTLTGAGADLKWNSTSSSAWDLGTTANWLNLGTGMPHVFYAGDTVLFDDSVADVVTSVTLDAPAAPTSVTVNSSANDFTFSGAGKITGPATLLKLGASTLMISNANDFTGTVTIASGTLKAGSATALGTGAGVTAINEDATLDINGMSLVGEPVTVTGAGVADNGAIVNNGAAQQSALRTILLNGNATFGGSARWDIRNTGGNASLGSAGQNHRITKKGPNQVTLVATTVDGGLGDVDIQEGIFAIQTTTTSLSLAANGRSFGDPLNMITIHSNAQLNLFRSPTPLDKQFTIKDGGIIWSENDSNVISGPILFEGQAVFNVANSGTIPALVLTGTLDGGGGFTKVNSGPLFLYGSYFYSGPTTLSNGTTFVEGSILVSSGVTVHNATLAGGGDLAAPIVITANGTLSPGSQNIPMAPLTINGSLTIIGTNVMDVANAAGTITNDRVQGSGTLNYGGTLRLNLSGSPLAAGQIIPLYGFTSASGSFARIIPATPGPGLLWDDSQLTVDGTLRVVSVPRPGVSSISLSGSDITMSGTNGLPNTSYYILTSTNITLPLANWARLATNMFDGSGNFSSSIPVDSGTPARFFILQVP